MQSDFMDASERHWDDAERLFQVQRWANADHLYGMSAECGLKRLMLAFGMPVDPATGSPSNKADKIHVDKIWAHFESYRSGFSAGTGYALPSANPFANWNVSDRYGHQSNFNQSLTEAHQVGAKAVRNLIKKAQQEGLV